jgi:hypothetical protein
MLRMLDKQYNLYSKKFLLNDGAKRNRFPYLKIMYTQVKKMLCLPKFFAFFGAKIRALSISHTTEKFCPHFLAFLESKLEHFLWLCSAGQYRL